MRREPILILLAGIAGLQPAAAQGLGWLLGEPPPSHRAARTHRLGRPRVVVPLPAPRPHFLGDTAVQADPAKPGEPGPTPLDRDAADAPALPPLPPERPSRSDLASPPTPPAGAEKPKDDATTTTDSPASSQPTSQPAAQTMPTPAPPLPRAKPADLAAPPAPAVAPSGATTAFNPRDPAPDAGCIDRLNARGVTVEATTLGPQPDQRCTVVQPLRLVSAKRVDGTSVAFPDQPTIACTTADAFSAYVHDLLAPLAKGTWGVGLASVWTGPGLECRSRDHIFGAKLSAHGQGLAVDIAQLKLDDGRLIAVGEPKTDAERDFEMAARAGGCGYFHTVLGPGSDSYHRTHWHFDLAVRGKDGDAKFCK